MRGLLPPSMALTGLAAAGTTGRELVFQASSEQMIEAYSRVPRLVLASLQILCIVWIIKLFRPFGTVFANDIFTSGVLLSE